MSSLTLLLPLYAQPNYLATCLRGLIRNSRLKNRIVVVWSDPAIQKDPFHPEYYSDYDTLINTNQLKKCKKYQTIQEYVERQADFIAEHEIEFIDVTEAVCQFKQEYKAGKIWEGNGTKPADTPWEGGQDIAWKNNFSIDLTTSEFVIPNWDADFYPSPGWDEMLLETASRMPPRSILVPVQVQPLEFDVLPQWQNAWEDSRSIACSRLTMPILKRGGVTVTDEELDAFYEEWNRDEIIGEKPGVREYLSHLATLFRTEELKNVIGKYNYQGAGYDLEMDNRCGFLGFNKFTDRRVWCIHKCFTAVRPEWI